MILNRFSMKLLLGVAPLLLLFFISFALRVFPPLDNLFVGEWIKFSSIDAYYHMRIVDQMVQNFPQAMSFDPFLLYPGGAPLSDIRFFDWLLAGITWIIGLGSPGQHTVDIVGVYYPVILAALTVIPAYFIGKTLFNNHWAGLIAALLVAVFPGEYIGRSMLGFTDYHAAETLFTTTAVMFLILAVKEGMQRGLSLGSFRNGNPGEFVKPVVYSLLAGLFLGIYLITWAGGLLFVFIFALYFIIQFIVDHLRGKPTQYLGITGFLLYLVAAVIFLPVSPGSTNTGGIIVGLLIPPVLAFIAWLMMRRGLKGWYYPLLLVVLGAVFVGVFYTVAPGVAGSMVSAFRIFAPMGASASTTLEMQPFLSPQGSFSTLVAWGNYTTSFFFYSPWWMVVPLILVALLCYLFRRQNVARGWAIFIFILFAVLIAIPVVFFLYPSDEFLVKAEYWVLPGFAFFSLFIMVAVYTRQQEEGKNLAVRIIALVLLAVALGFMNFAFIPSLLALGLFFIIFIWLAYRQDEDNHAFLFFITWTLIILILTLVQRRFAYYLVINMALLSAYISWQIIWHAGLKDWLDSRRQKQAEAENNASAKARRRQQVAENALPYLINTLLAAILVAVVIVYPNVQKAENVAGQALFAPSDAWQSSLLWLKDNTPPPFGSEEAYYEFQHAPAPGEQFAYPETAYGVTSWWDYGYWITRIAHRLPSTNPSQSAAPIIRTSNLLLSTDAGQVRELVAEMDSAYMVTDYSMTISKFWAVVEWADRPQTDFVQPFYLLYNGSLYQINGFTPEYYNSLVVRLYNFDGKAVTEGRPVVISYQEETSDQGQRIFVIPDESHINEFDTYQEGLDYIAGQTSGNHAIVSLNPFKSPVPLEAVENYRLIHSSEGSIFEEGIGLIPEVKIFEYTGG